MSPLTYTPFVTKPLFKVAGEIKTPPFSEAARVEAGALLRELQEGQSLGMPDSRPMPAIGPGCHELRITDETTIHRVFYAIRPDAIVLLATLTKKTTATPPEMIRTCAGRIRRYDEARKGR